VCQLRAHSGDVAAGHHARVTVQVAVLLAHQQLPLAAGPVGQPPRVDDSVVDACNDQGATRYDKLCTMTMRCGWHHMGTPVPATVGTLYLHRRTGINGVLLCFALPHQYVAPTHLVEPANKSTSNVRLAHYAFIFADVLELRPRLSAYTNSAQGRVISKDTCGCAAHMCLGLSPPMDPTTMMCFTFDPLAASIRFLWPSQSNCNEEPKVVRASSPAHQRDRMCLYDKQNSQTSRVLT